MTPERWEQIRDVLGKALELAPGERSAFLNRACSSDQSLRREVETLLASSNGVYSSFLQSPELDDRLDTDSGIGSAGALEAGQLFAQRFQVLRRLGEGGMGQVWLAEQIAPVRRQVALKLIKAGMYDEAVVQRFQSERQSLAIMDHPAIAKVFDAGATPQGQPYFVMEYVPGLPITEYCDQKKLKIRDRLELFIQACEGVQHAHQKAIIHRDLKPPNILVVEVDGKPVPRIIDFGLAKATMPQAADERLFTRPGHFVGTPGYMSPEQADPGMQDVDTRTDIYSLGVVLYVLLTGSQPFETKQRPKQPLDEWLRKLREEEPPRPSTKVSTDRDQSTSTAEARGTEPKQLVSALRGDLDCITMKALEKDRSRRYGTPSELAADIRRYLDQEPVVARPASAAYRSGKFIKRHRLALAVTAVFALVVLAGVVAIVREARVARTQQARAERRFNDVRKLANSLMFEVHDSIKDLPGSTPARKLLVSRALEYLDSLSHEAGSDVSLQRELASAYERVGDVQGNFYRSNLGDTAGALSSYQNAVAIREVLARGAPNDLEVQSDLADSYAKIASVARTMGEITKSVQKYRQSLAIREMLVQANPLSQNARYSLAGCHDYIGDGDTLNTIPDWKGALEEYEKGLAGFESLLAINPKEVRVRRMVAVTKTKIGYVFESTDKTAEALKEYREALSILEVLVAEDRSNALLQHNLSVTHLSLGDIRAKLGEFGPARKEFLEAISIDESLSRADPADMRLARNLAMVHAHLGDSEMKAGHMEVALREYRKALAIAETRSASDPANGEAQLDVAEYHRRLEQLHETKARRVGIPVAER